MVVLQVIPVFHLPAQETFQHLVQYPEVEQFVFEQVQVVLVTRLGVEVHTGPEQPQCFDTFVNI